MTLSELDSSYVRELARSHAAIVLDEDKEYLIEARLRPVVRQTGARSIAELVAMLRQGRQTHLRDLVIDALTTNETSWFRDGHPFVALRDHILPELIAARQAVRSLTIWCAAASTGQEPYSVAILIRERFPELAGWRLRIVATDISHTALEQARAGLYGELEIRRGMPASLTARYFEQVGAKFRLAEQVRAMVELRTLNLAREWAAVPRCDLVLLRNVMIYFDPVTKAQILDRMADRVLRPDGALVLGAAESTLGLSAAYHRVQHGSCSWYRLRGGSR
jgi:chemotaxis protein methyltransferase CheR